MKCPKCGEAHGLTVTVTIPVTIVGQGDGWALDTTAPIDLRDAFVSKDSEIYCSYCMTWFDLDFREVACV